MKAITYTKYGSAGVLKLAQIDKPIPSDNQILIKMMTTSINSADICLHKADHFFDPFGLWSF